MMIGTPQATISEGIAEVGPELLLGDARGDRRRAPRRASVCATTPDWRGQSTRQPIRWRCRRERGPPPARGRRSEDEYVAYLMRWSLATEPRAGTASASRTTRSGAPT